MNFWPLRAHAQAQAQADEQEAPGRQRAARMTNEELARIFLEIQPRLERVICRRIGDPQMAQDLAQDLYLRFQRMAAQLPNEDEARRYLMRMATNAAIDHLRSEKCRMQLLVGVLNLFDGHAPDPAEHTEVQEQYRLLDAALADLPPICRDILYLSRIEGLTHAEIGEKLGLSRSSIEKYVMRALKACRQHLQKT